MIDNTTYQVQKLEDGKISSTIEFNDSETAIAYVYQCDGLDVSASPAMHEYIDETIKIGSRTKEKQIIGKNGYKWNVFIEDTNRKKLFCEESYGDDKEEAIKYFYKLAWINGNYNTHKWIIEEN